MGPNSRTPLARRPSWCRSTRPPVPSNASANPQLRSDVMNFDLSEEQQVLQKTVRDFCAKHVIPHAAGWDAEERFPAEVIPLMAELGLLGMQIPESYGGAGMKFHDYVIALEEVAA